MAAVLNDGQSVITTAEKWIPEPPIGGDRQLRLMDDLRYGADDYTMWPQPLHPDLPHLPCIRAIHKGGVEDILFGELSEITFQRIRTDGFSGLGHIETHYMGQIINFVSECQRREQQLLQAEMMRFDTVKQRQIYDSLKVDIQSFLYRLRCLPSTFLTAQRTICQLQRVMLEWDAWLRYWETFRPKMEQAATEFINSDLTAVGCFVYRTEDAEAMQRAALPFWMIRPYEYVLEAGVEEVGHITKATDHELSSVPHRDGRVIFTGSAMDIGRYESIRTAGRALLSFPDPFSCIAAAAPLTVNIPSECAGPIRALNTLEQRRLTGSPCECYFCESQLANKVNRLAVVS